MIKKTYSMKAKNYAGVLTHGISVTVQMRIHPAIAGSHQNGGKLLIGKN